MVTANKILEQWVKYANYDEQQNRFNLFSSNYTYHEAGKRVKQIMQFEPSGALAVLYLKKIFLDVMRSSTVKVISLLENPNIMKDDREMYDAFMSEDIKKVEEDLLDRIDALVQLVVSAREIGERDRDAEREALVKIIESVVEEMTGCHEEYYLVGENPIGQITRFSTRIHVFERLSDCVLTMEQTSVEDGIYLCFIKNGDSADCFFCFMIKSAGNLFSYGERVPEEFPGEHINGRNNRWSEAKKYKLFPYEYMVSFGDYDYLGYSTAQTIDESKLAFFALGPSVYLPILLAMVCIANKYNGAKFNGKRLMVFDTLFSWNRNVLASETKALLKVSDSAIALRSREYSVPFDSEDILDGTYGKKHSYSELSAEDRKNGAVCGEFPEEQSIFVDLYGDGFVFDKSKVFVADASPSTKEEPAVEFVASSEHFDLLAYREGRRQLAEHIRKKMLEEFLAFGGADAVREWWEDSIRKNHDRIIDLCLEKYVYLENGGTSNVYEDFWTSTGEDFLSCISMRKDDKHCGGSYHPFNERKKDKYGRPKSELYLDEETGALCTINFKIRPRDWKELEVLFGKLPKTLTGWDSRGHREYGNSLLRITDPVSGVGNICEYDEQKRQPLYQGHNYYNKDAWYQAPRTDFDFCVAFSVRGLNAALKKKAEKESGNK